MTGDSNKGENRAALDRAAALVVEALDLLDAYDGPPQAAAYLQLALSELAEARRGPPP
jgi:hypothetical protein